MLDIIFVLSVLAFLGFLSVLIIIFTCNRFLIGVEMGVDYKQHCMVAVSFDWDELKRITSKAEYKFEDRYDTRTGKVTHQEKVLVREEKVHYELCGRKFDHIRDIRSINRTNGLDVEIDDENQIVYIGLSVSKSEDIGRVYLLYDSLDISSLEKLQNEVREILPQYSNRVGLHFFYTVS